MMTPAILACLSQSDPFGQYIGLALLVFGICLLTVSLQSQKRIQEFLRQRFTNPSWPISAKPNCIKPSSK